LRTEGCYVFQPSTGGNHMAAAHMIH
jgi:hypothetical protein